VVNFNGQPVGNSKKIQTGMDLKLCEFVKSRQAKNLSVARWWKVTSILH